MNTCSLVSFVAMEETETVLDPDAIPYRLDVTKPVTELVASELESMPFVRTLLGLTARMLVVSSHQTASFSMDGTPLFVLYKPESGSMPEQVADDFLDSLDKDANVGVEHLDDGFYDHESFPHEGEEALPGSDSGSDAGSDAGSETGSDSEEL